MAAPKVTKIKAINKWPGPLADEFTEKLACEPQFYCDCDCC